MPIPWLAVGAGALLGGLLGGSRGQKTEAKSVPSLTPEQQLIASQLQGRISQRLGYPGSAYSGMPQEPQFRQRMRGFAPGANIPPWSETMAKSGQTGQAGGPSQPFGAELEDPAIAALKRALAVDPRFAATYGMMGLRAIQASTAAVPLAQQIWQEPYQMAQGYLQTPMMSTYLEQPAPNPLVSLLGAAAPIIGGYLAGPGGAALGGLLGQTTRPQLSPQARGYTGTSRYI